MSFVFSKKPTYSVRLASCSIPARENARARGRENVRCENPYHNDRAAIEVRSSCDRAAISRNREGCNVASHHVVRMSACAAFQTPTIRIPQAVWVSPCILELRTCEFARRLARLDWDEHATRRIRAVGRRSPSALDAVCPCQRCESEGMVCESTGHAGSAPRGWVVAAGDEKGLRNEAHIL